MAPKAVSGNSGWVSRLREAAGKSAQKAKDEFNACRIDKLTCSYASGDAVHGRLGKQSRALFEWYVEGGGHASKAEVDVNCKDAARRGVPFPVHWRTAIRCSCLGATIENSVQKLRDMGVASPSLRMLGVPKRSPPPLLGTTLVPGAVAQLQTRCGSRQDYLLVAKIDGDRRADVTLRSAFNIFVSAFLLKKRLWRWWCSNTPGKDDDEEPFPLSSLVLHRTKDLRACSLVNEGLRALFLCALVSKIVVLLFAARWRRTFFGAPSNPRTHHDVVSEHTSPERSWSEPLVDIPMHGLSSWRTRSAGPLYFGRKRIIQVGRQIRSSGRWRDG